MHSDPSPPHRRTNLPLLLATAGLVAWAGWTHTWLATLALVFCPGWGLTRCVSVLDRNFGVLGSSLCLSPLVLGLLAHLGTLQQWSTRELGLAAHIAALGLCLAGRVRLVFHDRWQARQPPHPQPMALWPARTSLCVIVVVMALTAVLASERLLEPGAGGDRLEVASHALGWQAGGEDPLLAGHPLRRDELLPAATATLAAGTGQHVAVAGQLLVLCALVAVLLLLAEGISRLWGNRGGTRAMLAFLLGLNPLATLFMLGSPSHDELVARMAPGFDPGITSALSPFLDGSPMALTLAFAALVLFALLSTLRRSSTHVPRLAALGSLGLVLADPRAAILLLPGCVLGVLMSHLACLDSPDNDPHRSGGVRRAGEPRWLRAPFWRPALHLTLGAAAGFALADVRLPDVGMSRMVTWGLVAGVGPGCLLYMPGVRHLNASPGREAYFFVGLVVLTGLLGIGLGFPDDQGELVVRLLALVLSVPAANGALKVVELYGTRARFMLAGLVLAVLPGPAALLDHVDGRARPVAIMAPDVLRPSSLPTTLAGALQQVGAESPSDAVLVLDASTARGRLAVTHLVARRPLLVAPADAPDSRRMQAVSRLAAGDGTALATLRGLPGLEGREFWAVHPGPSWPGLETVARSGQLLVERARMPDIVLLTISSLRTDRLTPEHMPHMSERFDGGLQFLSAITPYPATAPGLGTLLSGLSPVDHELRDEGRVLAADIPVLQQRLAQRGYRTTAVVSTSPRTGLLGHFERVRADPTASADTLVDVALAELAQADPRPTFLWLHLSDLELPYRLPERARTEETGRDDFPLDPDLARTHYGRVSHPPHPAPGALLGEVDLETGRAQYDAQLGLVDEALERLFVSVPPSALLVLTAPHGMSLDEHEAYFDHGGDLFEPAIRVPLLLVGAGMPAGTDTRLASLADVPDLLLEGRLPQRDRVLLESAWRPGLGTGRAYPPELDPTSRGAARRIWGERTARRKTVMTTERQDGHALDGVAFDLEHDPDEMRPQRADPFDLRRIDTWRRRGRPATLEEPGAGGEPPR